VEVAKGGRPAGKELSGMNANDTQLLVVVILFLKL
jgi:hypothetical protein